MKERKRCLARAVACVALACGFSGVMAQTNAAPIAQTVAEWNRLPFVFDDANAAQRYDSEQLYKKVLLQGVKLDSQGNIYVTTARWGGTDVPATLSKLVRKDGNWVLQPYPSAAMNKVGDPHALQSVLGFEIDRNDVMWILDQGHIAGAPSTQGAEKLVLWDIKHNREIQRHDFTDAETDKKCSFLNDVAVDNDSGFAYITDSGILCDPLHGGLIVYDQKHNTARRILDQTVFTNDEAGFTFRIDNQQVLPKTPMRTGADGIALSGDKRTLYWTNLSGHALYSIDTALLRDFHSTPTTLQTAIKRVATLPSNTDGMTANRHGQIYMTALEHNGLMRFDEKTGRISTVISDPDMVWPDTLAWGPDGDLYFVTGHLNLWVANEMDFDHPSVPNFRIWKIKADGPSYTAK
ncbi:L-dopachrome tautomerase-related protein [Robbsia sp. KACC 23696]|uniref:L-dopachrome tautomerase-related protein n=1 Tax=Robbsia sp. KACC 23696 TaxID=3149231 RepID=UPI00325A5852